MKNTLVNCMGVSYGRGCNKGPNGESHSKDKLLRSGGNQSGWSEPFYKDMSLAKPTIASEQTSMIETASRLCNNAKQNN